MREAAGSDADGILSQFRGHALEDAVDQSDVAVEEADLEIVYGICADYFWRTFDFDTGQARSACEERLSGDVEAGSDGSADEFAFGGDDVEVGRRAEVDDDAGASVFFECADAVSDTVGSGFAGMVDADGHPGFDSGLDKERLLVEVSFAELAQNPVDGGDDGGDDDSADVWGLNALALKKIADKDSVFVGGLALTRADAPCDAQLAGAPVVNGVNRDDGVRIVYVEGKKHRSPVRFVFPHST